MRVRSHLELHLETSWGLSARQDGPSWSKMTARWRYVGQLESQDGQLGAILESILLHFSYLERNLNKNSGSVKMNNPTTLLVVF